MQFTYAHEVASIGDRARARRRVDEPLLTDAVVLALGALVKMRDRNTLGHCQRLAAHAAATGARLGLAVDDLRTLHQGGYLHDLGKIAIPNRILRKPGHLTPREFATMKLHPVIGDALCQALPLLHRVRPIVRWHHERLDGTGYPDGLKGDRIPLLAQLIGIADVYDALTSARPYKAAQSHATACEALIDEIRKGWRRRDLVEAFMGSLTEAQTSGLAA